MRGEHSAYLYITFVILFWASTAAVSKLLLMDLGNLQLLFFTCSSAAGSLFFIVLLQDKIHIIREYTVKDYLNFIYMGFIGVFLYTFFLFEALKNLRAQEAFILNYLWPIMVVVFSTIILKETFTLRKFLGLFVSFIGVTIIFTQMDIPLDFSSLRGTLSAIGCALSYGLFSVLGKKREYDKYISMMFYYLFSSIFSSASLLIDPNFPHISIAQFIGILWLGVFTNGVAFVFWFLALKEGDTAKMSNIVFLTPFLSLVYIHLLLGERILMTSILGLIFILLGILIQSTRGDEAPRGFIPESRKRTRGAGGVGGATP